jgi:hypothetical protein
VQFARRFLGTIIEAAVRAHGDASRRFHDTRVCAVSLPNVVTGGRHVSTPRICVNLRAIRSNWGNAIALLQAIACSTATPPVAKSGGAPGICLGGRLLSLIVGGTFATAAAASSANLGASPHLGGDCCVERRWSASWRCNGRAGGVEMTGINRAGAANLAGSAESSSATWPPHVV